MTETKYGNNIIYQTEASQRHLPGTFPGTPVFNIDETVIKGGFYYECVWMYGPVGEDMAGKPHCHDFDEYIGFLGSDAKDPFNLNAEIEMWLGDEAHIITRSCVVHIPKGLYHTPVFVRKIDKPILCFSTAPVTKYEQEVSKDPKWSHLHDELGE